MSINIENQPVVGRQSLEANYPIEDYEIIEEEKFHRPIKKTQEEMFHQPAEEIQEEKLQQVADNLLKKIGLESEEIEQKNLRPQNLTQLIKDLYENYRKAYPQQDFHQFADCILNDPLSTNRDLNVKKFVKTYDDVKIAAYSNKTLTRKQDDFRPGVSIGILVGDKLQTLTIAKKDLFYSTVENCGDGEKRLKSLDGAIWISSKTASTKKTNIIARFFFGICRAIQSPFQTKTRMFTSSIIISLIAAGIGLGYFSSLGSYIPAPIKTYAWNVTPSWNGTKAFLERSWEAAPSWNTTKAFLERSWEAAPSWNTTKAFLGR